MDIVWRRNFSLPKGSRIPRPPRNMAQFELGSEAQWTKWLPRSIFYRWYDQWTLSKSVKVQQSSKWGKFNSAQIKAVDGRSSPRFEGCSKLRIVHDGFLWCHASYDGQFCCISFFFWLTVPSTWVILSLVEIESRHKNTPLLDIE